MSDNLNEQQSAELESYRRAHVAQGLRDAAEEAGATAPAIVAQMLSGRATITEGQVMVDGVSAAEAIEAMKPDNQNLFASIEPGPSEGEGSEEEDLNTRLGQMSVEEYRAWRRSPEARRVMAHSQRAESRRRNRKR